MLRAIGAAATSGLLAAALAFSFPASVAAQSGFERLGIFTDWVAWKGTDAAGMICYISSNPESSEPTQVNGRPIDRGAIHFLVIHRKATGERNEVQAMVGYPMQMQNGVSVPFAAIIDGTNYQMLTVADEPSTASINENYGAWLADQSQQAAFVTAMKAGSSLQVRGMSQRGTQTVDTYSLSGVTAAMAAIDAACA